MRTTQVKYVIIEPNGRAASFPLRLPTLLHLGRLGHDVTLAPQQPTLKFSSRTAPSCSTVDAALRPDCSGRVPCPRGFEAGCGVGAARWTCLATGVSGLKLTVAWRGVLRRVGRGLAGCGDRWHDLHPHILSITACMATTERVLAQIRHQIVERDVEAASTPRTWRDAIQDRLVARFDRILLPVRGDEAGFSEDPPVPAGSHHADFAWQVGNLPRRDAVRLGDAAAVGFSTGRDRDSVLRNSAPVQGLDELVDAFAQARARGTARLLIAGCATKFMDMTAFHARIARHDLTDAVRVENRYIDPDEVAPLFELARAVVLPYRNAAASGVLHMAYAFERAPIVTAVGGLAEDVIAGETGLVAAPGDIAGLACLIDRVVDDAELAAGLGRAGNAFSRRNFGWASVAERIAGTLASDVRSHPPLASGTGDVSQGQIEGDGWAGGSFGGSGWADVAGLAGLF